MAAVTQRQPVLPTVPAAVPRPLSAPQVTTDLRHRCTNRHTVNVAATITEPCPSCPRSAAQRHPAPPRHGGGHDPPRAPQPLPRTCATGGTRRECTDDALVPAAWPTPRSLRRVRQLLDAFHRSCLPCCPPRYYGRTQEPPAQPASVPGPLGQQLHLPSPCPPRADPLLLPSAGIPPQGGAAEGPPPCPPLRQPGPLGHALCHVPCGLLRGERQLLLSPGWEDSVTPARAARTQAAGPQPGTEPPSPGFQNKPVVLDHALQRVTSPPISAWADPTPCPALGVRGGGFPPRLAGPPHPPGT